MSDRNKQPSLDSQQPQSSYGQPQGQGQSEISSESPSDYRPESDYSLETEEEE